MPFVMPRASSAIQLLLLSAALPLTAAQAANFNVATSEPPTDNVPFLATVPAWPPFRVCALLLVVFAATLKLAACAAVSGKAAESNNS